MESSLKQGIKTEVRQALVSQIARRMDDEKMRETSLETVSLIIEDEMPVRNLVEALYGTTDVTDLPNRSAGRLVADVAKSRRQKVDWVPVRAEESAA